jgi:hypothetical protein
LPAEKRSFISNPQNSMLKKIQKFVFATSCAFSRTLTLDAYPTQSKSLEEQTCHLCVHLLLSQSKGVNKGLSLLAVEEGNF